MPVSSSGDWGRDSGMPKQDICSGDRGRDSGMPKQDICSGDLARDSGMPKLDICSGDWGRDPGMPKLHFSSKDERMIIAWGNRVVALGKYSPGLILGLQGKQCMHSEIALPRLRGGRCRDTKGAFSSGRERRAHVRTRAFYWRLHSANCWLLIPRQMAAR